MPPPVVVRLTVDSPRRRFGVGGLDKLREALEAVDRASDVAPVTSPEDVTIRGDGRVGHGLRLTNWALYQLCRDVCPGLYRVIAGLQDGGEETTLAAIGIFNQLVRLRYRDALADRQMLCDRVAGTVDAVVSSRYKFLPNRALLDAVCASAAKCGKDVRFYEAVLQGRWFMARHYQSPALFEAPDGRYHAGYHFSNQEGGQSSLRGANSVVRSKGLLTFLGLSAGDKYVRHAGRKFGDRLQSLIDKVLGHEVQAEVYRDAVETLRGQSLGLGQRYDAQENKRRRQLVGQLKRRSTLPRSLCARIVASAMTQAGDVDEASATHRLSLQEVSSRTVYDLMIAASREGKRCAVATREAAERLAFGLLSGRLRVR